MRNEIEYIVDRITEYTKKSRESENRIADFLKVNCISDLKDCDSLKTLEILFRIETFMFVENEVKK